MAGGEHGALARRGIARVLEERDGSVAMRSDDGDSAYDGWADYPVPESYAWRSIASRYRLILFEDGEEIVKSDGVSRKVSRKGISSEAVEAELEREGRMSRAEVLRSKTRYFIDGGVIGGREFVSNMVKSLKGNYLSEDRKSEGKKMPKHGGSLWSMRRLTDE